MTEQSGNEQFSLEFFSTARQDIQLRVFCILLARAATSVPASVFVPVTDVCVWNKKRWRAPEAQPASAERASV